MPRWSYVRRRLVSAALTLVAAVSLVFVLLRMLPGSPADAAIGESFSSSAPLPLEIAEPWPAQYFHFLTNVAHGDLGTSFHSGEPVTTLLVHSLRYTFLLATTAVLAALFLALPLGAVAAARPASLLDRLTRIWSVLIAAVPTFWLAPLLILLFSLSLRWTPVSGSATTAHLVLPALTLALGMSASLSRLIRTLLLERLDTDYIRTARAKGVAPSRVLLTHALRSAAAPLLTVIGAQFGHLLAGTLITETIFAWPGLGRLLVSALLARDHAVTQGCVTLIAAIYLGVNLLTDLLAAAADPRIELEPE